jgi:hypothetical protein
MPGMLNRQGTVTLIGAVLVLVALAIFRFVALKPLPSAFDRTHDQPAGVVEQGPRDPADVLQSDRAPNASHASPVEQAAFPDREQFIKRMRTAAARDALGDAIPLEIPRLVGEGRYRDAARTLLQMGRDGDINAYAALDALLASCPGKSADPAFQQRATDRAARDEQMLEQARDLDTPEHLIQRLTWSLETHNDNRELWKELCPAEGEGDYVALRAEARRAVPPETTPEFDADARRLMRERRWRELNDLTNSVAPRIRAQRQRLADAGLLNAQLMIAHEDLLAGDAARQAAALRTLRALAPSSPRAKAMLAECLRAGCVPGEDIDDEWYRLLSEAARAGSVAALETLTDDSLSDESLDALAVDRYAWTRVRDQLAAQGCLTPAYTGGWAFTQARAPDALLSMSPADAEMAKRQAAELVTAEVPRLQSILGCDDGTAPAGR